MTGSDDTWQKIIPVDCQGGGGECSTGTVITELSSAQSYMLTARASNRYGTSEVSVPVLVPAAGEGEHTQPNKTFVWFRLLENERV